MSRKSRAVILSVSERKNSHVIFTYKRNSDVLLIRMVRNFQLFWEIFATIFTCNAILLAKSKLPNICKRSLS